MFKRTVMFVFLTFALGLLGAGCGSDETATETDDGPPTGTQEQIDSGEIPSAAGMMGDGNAPPETEGSEADGSGD